MKMLPFAIAGCCLFAACQPEPVNTIQVTGEATMKVVPNMVELSLRVYNVRPAMRDAVAETEGGDYELNLYSKSFGGRGFKMSSQILECRDVAFAGFALNQ